MKKLKIYLDTSVIGGCFDDEFSIYSNRLINNIKNNIIIGVISEITFRELENAPDFVKNHFNSYKEKLEIIKLTDEVTDLAKQYIDEKVISKNFMKMLYIFHMQLLIKLIYWSAGI